MNTNLYTPPQKKVDTGYAARLLKNGSLSEPGPRTRTTLEESGNKTDLFDISEDFDISGGAEFEHDDYAYPYPQMNTSAPASTRALVGGLVTVVGLRQGDNSLTQSRMGSILCSTQALSSQRPLCSPFVHL
jgi:hypothetical protein